MSQVDRVAALLASMERRLRDLERAPQLGNSSVEGGINYYDPTRPTQGPSARVGALPDGSWGIGVYRGPIPPQPTRPTLRPTQGGLTVTWDGGFTPDPETGEPRYVPMDFTRIEVHCGRVPGFYDGSAAYLVGTIESPRGGSCPVIPLAIETKYVVLVCRNLPGGASIPSEEASGMPGSFVTDEEIQQIKDDLEANRLALVAANEDITQANTDIDAAFTSAANAKSIADIATGKADAAAQAAGASMTAANGKNKSFFGSEPPTPSAVNDVWFDSDRDNLPHKWDGSTWVEQPLGNAAIGNLDAAKISTGYLAAARILVGSLSGDKITANTLNGDKIIGNTIHGDKITGNTITGGKIMADEIVGLHIRSREIGADKIKVGAISADLIDANAVTAGKIEANAITGKYITGGVFRTGVYPNDRIEIMDESGYDMQGNWRTLRDTIRWIRGYDNALVGEVRGYMGDVGAYGLHLNSDIELGNTQSVTHVMGRIAAESFAKPSDRLRAGRVITNIGNMDANGHNVHYYYPVAMDTAPLMWCATVNSGGGSAGDAGIWSGLYTITNFQANTNGWSASVLYADGRTPGAGGQVQISYWIGNFA